MDRDIFFCLIPRASGKSPDFRGSRRKTSPEVFRRLPRKFSHCGTLQQSRGSPEVSQTSPEVPRASPEVSRTSPEVSLSLGSLTPSPDSQKLSLSTVMSFDKRRQGRRQCKNSGPCQRRGKSSRHGAAKGGQKMEFTHLLRIEVHHAIVFAIAREFCRRHPFARDFWSENELLSFHSQNHSQSLAHQFAVLNSQLFFGIWWPKFASDFGGRVRILIRIHNASLQPRCTQSMQMCSLFWRSCHFFHHHFVTCWMFLITLRVYRFLANHSLIHQRGEGRAINPTMRLRQPLHCSSGELVGGSQSPRAFGPHALDIL